MEKPEHRQKNDMNIDFEEIREIVFGMDSFGFHK